MARIDQPALTGEGEAEQPTAQIRQVVNQEWIARVGIWYKRLTAKAIQRGLYATFGEDLDPVLRVLQIVSVAVQMDAWLEATTGKRELQIDRAEWEALWDKLHDLIQGDLEVNNRA